MNEIVKPLNENLIPSVLSWLEVQLLKTRYYTFLLGKCLRKNDFGYFRFIYKLRLGILISRLPVLKNKIKKKEEYASVSSLKERFQTLLGTYIFFRIDDDIGDGEFGHMSAAERTRYILDRLESVTRDDWNRNPAIDTLTKNVMELARKLGIAEELRKCFQEVMESLLFDAQRIQKFQEEGELVFFPENTLIEHYFRLDSLGTGQGMMYVFGDNPENIPSETIQQCTACSDAVRISYTLRDFLEDIRTGVVNIPQEEAESYGITVEHIKCAMNCSDLSTVPMEIRRWCRGQITIAKELFGYGMSATQPGSGLGDLSRHVLNTNYGKDFWRDIKKVEEQLGIRDSLPKKIEGFTYMWGLKDGYIILMKLFWKYGTLLQMNIVDQKKMLAKSIKLFLMYIGFASESTGVTIGGAACAAFLSATYDWVTDGEKKSDELCQKLRYILSQVSPGNAYNIGVIEMLQKDKEQTLQNDGLERGATSFKFIIAEMGLSEHFSEICDIDEVGQMLQVIDDIDDWEQDTAEGEWNVLNTPRKQEYIDRMEQCFHDNGATIFPGENARLLRWFIAKMRDKVYSLPR